MTVRNVKGYIDIVNIEFSISFQQNVHVILPFGVMALTGFLAGLLCFTLPETRNLPTQEVAGPTETQVAPADPGTELAQKA